MLSTIKHYRFLFLTAVLFMFLSYAFNVFGVNGGNTWFKTYQKDSEILVVNKLACQEFFGRDELGGMLGKAKDGTGKTNETFLKQESQGVCEKDNIAKYYSQYGIQGKVYQLGYDVSRILPGMTLPRFILIAQLMTALTTALTLSLFVVWVAREFDSGSAIVVSALLMVSVWIVGYARNLYWAAPLFFLPLIYTAFFYGRKKKWQSIPFYVGLYLLFVVRFLAGYEFTPEIILSVVAMIVYLLYKEKNYYTLLARESAMICAIGLIAFVTAFGLHFQQVYATTHNSTQALNLIKSRIAERTGDPSKYRGYTYAGLQNTAPEIYNTVSLYVDLDSLKESKPPLVTELVAILNYALLPVITLPVVLAQPLGTIVGSLSSLAIVSFLLINKLKKNSTKEEKRQLYGLQRAMFVGLLASSSWLVLANAHSLVHAHINGIIFYIPFLLFAYIAFGLWFSRKIDLLKKQFFSKKKV